MGVDLNRTWNQISRWIHPTLHAAFTFITNLDQDKVSTTQRRSRINNLWNWRSSNCGARWIRCIPPGSNTNTPSTPSPWLGHTECFRKNLSCFRSLGFPRGHILKSIKSGLHSFRCFVVCLYEFYCKKILFRSTKKPLTVKQWNYRHFSKNHDTSTFNNYKMAGVSTLKN